MKKQVNAADLLLISLIVILNLLGCVNEEKSATLQSKVPTFTVALPKLQYFGNIEPFVNAIEGLKQEYEFGAVGMDGVSILHIKNREDSVFFNFTSVSADCLELHFRDYHKNLVVGYAQVDGVSMLVFDEVGLFRTTPFCAHFDFGKQEVNYYMMYEPLLLKYYLRSDGQITFIDEQWLDYGQQ